VDGEALAPSLRRLLELDLQRLVDEGHMLPAGERELRIRIDTDGRIRWFEPVSVRVPASELERVERGTPGAAGSVKP
jgi:hypothetical protein